MIDEGAAVVQKNGRPPLAEARHLVKHFRLPGVWLSRKPGTVHALDDVSFTIRRGEVLALVGESGCGKTTLGRLLLGLAKPTRGEVLFENADLSSLRGDDLRALRRKLQIVFQNPISSLSPRLKILDVVAEPLRTHQLAASPAELRERVIGLLELVGLGQQHLMRFPHELSGGQCQRVAIARALALNPSMVVLDEPTSALDVSVQAQILNLLEDLRGDLDITYVFISHDLSVVRHISERIGVMYLGKLVEMGDTETLFDQPLHPYTQALLSAIPVPEVGHNRKQIILEGTVPDPVNPPAGCRFHTRCPFVQDVCRITEPPLIEVRPGRQVACHLIDQNNAPSWQ